MAPPSYRGMSSLLWQFLLPRYLCCQLWLIEVDPHLRGASRHSIPNSRGFREIPSGVGQPSRLLKWTATEWVDPQRRGATSDESAGASGARGRSPPAWGSRVKGIIEVRRGGRSPPAWGNCVQIHHLLRVVGVDPRCRSVDGEKAVWWGPSPRLRGIRPQIGLCGHAAYLFRHGHKNLYSPRIEFSARSFVEWAGQNLAWS